ncbi:MAG: DUF455 family protein [Planctomycetes bacterium]|nr:DUF455 family protein [Planctomycetota bacterium]
MRDYALRCVLATTLADKLAPPPDGLTDAFPRGEILPRAPGRPPQLEVAERPVRVPPLEGMADPAQRARILHAFANHELQAVELFAWALLAHADAPEAYRRGLLSVLADEQRHLAAYVGRLDDFGVPFGSLPVSGYFWGKLDGLATPLGFVCSMCLTFENSNLDHTLDHAEAARAVGDDDTSALLLAVHADELRHVRFGLRWLDAFRGPDESRVAAYRRTVRWPLRAALARGPVLHREAREAAGFDDEFTALLMRASDRTRRDDD